MKKADRDAIDNLAKINWSEKNWTDISKISNNGEKKGLFKNSKKKGFATRVAIAAILLGLIIYVFVSQFSISSKITPSTISRTKLESSVNFDSNLFYLDDAGIVNNSNNMKSSEKKFYNKTGVMPFTYFLSRDVAFSQDELNAIAKQQYYENFSDEDHFAVAFSDYDGQANFGYYVGENAKSVMDTEAIQIYSDYLNMYYNDRTIDFEPFMVNTYKYTGERIMSTMNFSTTSLIFGLLFITFFVYTLYTLIRR